MGHYGVPHASNKDVHTLIKVYFSFFCDKFAMYLYVIPTCTEFRILSKKYFLSAFGTKSSPHRSLERLVATVTNMWLGDNRNL